MLLKNEKANILGGLPRVWLPEQSLRTNNYLCLPNPAVLDFLNTGKTCATEMRTERGQNPMAGVVETPRNSGKEIENSGNCSHSS